MRHRQHLANEHFLQLEQLLPLAPPDGSVVPELGNDTAGVVVTRVDCIVEATLNVGDVVSLIVENEELGLGPNVGAVETAVVAELRVEVDELLLNELTDTPDMVTGTDAATCCA